MAIGDTVVTLSTPGFPGAVYALASNPGGFFGVSGSNIIEAINTPAGQYSFSVTMTAPGATETLPITVLFSSSGNFALLTDGTPALLTDGTPALLVN